MEKKLNIAIGCDHAGVDHKNFIIEKLSSLGHQLFNAGTDSKESVDYPDYAHQVAIDVESHRADLGILICGSANGVCMTANKHAGIRAALCWTSEIAALARQHNNANVICLPARFVSEQEALDMALTFIATDFEGGRHQKRVDKISC